MQLLEQKRALHALNFIRGEQKRSGEAQKMATHIYKTPIRVLNNGLGQALAFLLSDNAGASGQDRQPSGRLYDHLQNWLCGQPDDAHPMRIYRGGSPDLISQLMVGNREQYLRAQEESLRLFVWLRKFSDAYLGVGG